MSDDIYLNDGETYTPPGVYYPKTENPATDAELQTQAAIAQSLPIMGEVAAWFEQEIQNCDNIHNIQVTSLTVNGVKYGRDISVEAQVLAFQLLKEMLQNKARDFESFKDEA